MNDGNRPITVTIFLGLHPPRQQASSRMPRIPLPSPPTEPRETLRAEVEAAAEEATLRASLKCPFPGPGQLIAWQTNWQPATGKRIHQTQAGPQSDGATFPSPRSI